MEMDNPFDDIEEEDLDDDDPDDDDEYDIFEDDEPDEKPDEEPDWSASSVVLAERRALHRLARLHRPPCAPVPVRLRESGRSHRRRRALPARGAAPSTCPNLAAGAGWSSSGRASSPSSIW